MRDDSTREAVRRRYATLASAAAHGSSCCTPDEQAVFGSSRYGDEDLEALPRTAAVASIGCGNPTSVAELAEGEIVLDLGSGGGIDVILSARRVGPSGKAFGVDMTDEMLELARRNATEAGIDNVEFLKGHIEQIPLPDATVDVVISNCVINLSTDKGAVLAEAARVLRPGGRFAVSDVVADPDMDDATRAEVDQWTGCVAGALTADAYSALLTRAGLTDITIDESHRVHPHAVAAIIRARKPGRRGSHCAPPLQRERALEVLVLADGGQGLAGGEVAAQEWRSGPDLCVSSSSGRSGGCCRSGR